VTQAAPASRPLDARPSDATLTGALAAFYETTKPRIARLVTITAGLGFGIALFTSAAPVSGWLPRLLITLVGTFLSAGGANSLNQWMERDRDARMHRTASRPIPSGRLDARTALAGAWLISIAGITILAAGVGWPAALVAALTILAYTYIYTPLKPVTPLATQVGAGPGAAGPLIGWLGAHAGDPNAFLHPMPWILFGLMVVWQVPHFLAIAWMHREDYARGGFRVLPVVDGAGPRTPTQIALWTALLIVLTPLPALAAEGTVAWIYPAIALPVTGLFGYCAFRAAISRRDAHARAAFLASLPYIPLVFGALLLDAVV